ncbi:hypothetical protein TNCV_2479551 [Trichonephila clavipes]|nr:hypothetical protein TNCV_2479551 [Trichonephila clavipes]
MEVCSSDEKYPNKDAKDLNDSVVQIAAACKEKLRQFTFTVNQFNRHSRREKLTSEDFKKYLKVYGLYDDSEDSDSSNSDSDANLSDDEDESISIACHVSLKEVQTLEAEMVLENQMTGTSHKKWAGVNAVKSDDLERAQGRGLELRQALSVSIE